MPISRAMRGGIVVAVAAEKAVATLVGSVRRVGLDVELRDVADRVDLVVPEGAAIVGLQVQDLVDRADLVVLPGRERRDSREAEGRVRLALGVVDKVKGKGRGLLEVDVLASGEIGIVGQNRLRCRYRN